MPAHRITRSRDMRPNLGVTPVTSIGDPLAHPRHDPARFDAAGDVRVCSRAPARERWSLALYDFVNTRFSVKMVMLYFAVWMVSDLGASNTVYELCYAIASALVVVSIHVLGAISDARRRRKS